MELHPLCTLFPRIEGAEFDALVADIKQNGQREPIITHDGMILDGGNRYRACIAAGVEPHTMKFGGTNIVSYVLSANLHRRHLTAGQHAAIVASCQNWAESQTVGRPKKSGKIAELPQSENGNLAAIPSEEKTGKIAGLSTVAERAATSGASERTQRMADMVARQSPDLSKQVARGEVSLPKAVEQLTGNRPGQRVEKEQFDPRETELEEARDMIKMLSEELQALKDRIAIDAMPYSEEEKTLASETIAELREEVKNLRIQLDAVTVSRDSFQQENAQLKKQCQIQRKQIDKFNNATPKANSDATKGSNNAESQSMGSPVTDV